MSVETNNYEVTVDTAEMEAIIHNAKVNRDTTVDMGYRPAFDPIGSAVSRVVKLTPVSYAGDEQPKTYVRPAVDEFWLTKPG